jgi:hypothetical protein
MTARKMLWQLFLVPDVEPGDISRTGHNAAKGPNGMGSVSRRELRLFPSNCTTKLCG